MAERILPLDIRTKSDQWVTDCYCRELLKIKATLHFQGKIDLGQADMALFKRCRRELKRRGLLLPHLNFRVYA